MSTTTTTTVETVTRPRQVDTVLNYYLEAADGGGETETYAGTASDKLKQFDRKHVKVTDVRGHEEEFSLDKNCFQYVKAPTELRTDMTREQHEEIGFRESTEIIKKVTGATRVVPMFHSFRKSTYHEAIQIAKNAKDPKQIIPLNHPLMLVHVDQSDDGAVLALLDKVPEEEAARLQKTRWAIINVWRGLETVRRSALAVLDAQTIQDSEMRNIRLIMPQVRVTGDHKVIKVEKAEKDKEICQWAYSPEHRWYHKSEMERDDVLLLKCNESKLDGRARRCIHSAFDTEFDVGGPRQSIEVRCLVFWEDQDAE